MKRIIYITLFIAIKVCHTQAQTARFTSSGTIDFEKKVNTYALIRKGQIKGKFVTGNEQQLFEQYQVSNPQFRTFRSTLTFSNNNTLFTPVDKQTVTGNGFNIPMAGQNNTIYCDHNTGISIAQKSVLGDDFLLTDSVRKIKWRLTDETREIAGYTCRRANGVMMDSIYVVAFFTEKIHIAGGPESFGGLPGMILQVALPHENVTWLATRILDMAIPPADIKPPKGGKTMDNKKLMDVLKDALQNTQPAQAALTIKNSLL
ncbi:GLPGLI family protein [Mucilaginibacter sp. UYCu711]|uniref:GLPGLI family protein n=1 Tax=Mucilaginibacter sp. UYCu711 TaxID=3156339 RepID=UPI003D1A02F3